MRDKSRRDVVGLGRHQKQRHVTLTVKNIILLSMQYRESVPISSDIGTLAPRILLHFLISQYL